MRVMNINKLSFNILLIAVFLILCVPTIYKVVKHHQESSYVVSEKLAIEKAKECYYKKDCALTKVTLKELYDKKYITEKLVDPKTKEEYSDQSYVLITKEESTFHLA